MSHRIEYFHLAVHYPQAVLQEALPNENIFGDHYLCLALGGDNNMTTYHPQTQREVCSRRWMIVAAGGASDCIRQIACFSGECEVGNMRLTGERHTKPETYIRSFRHSIEKALSFERVPLDVGMSLKAKLSVSASRRDERAWQVNKLSSQMLPAEDSGGNLSWTLNLLAPLDAALFFVFGSVDPSEVWTKTEVYGECFGRGFGRFVRAVEAQGKVAA